MQRSIGGFFVLALALSLYACQGETDEGTGSRQPTGAAADLVLDAGDTLAGTRFVTRLDWDGMQDLVTAVLPDLAGELQDLGLAGAAASIFVSDGPAADPIDLRDGGRILVSIALVFDGDSASSTALATLRNISTALVSESGGEAVPIAADGVVAGAEGLAVDDRIAPGGLAVAAWTRGPAVLIAAAQGGDPADGAFTVAALMAEREPAGTP